LAQSWFRGKSIFRWRGGGITAGLLPATFSLLATFLLSLRVVYALIERPIFRRQERLALEEVQAALGASATT
jgi:hypothetical protein